MPIYKRLADGILKPPPTPHLASKKSLIYPLAKKPHQTWPQSVSKAERPVNIPTLPPTSELNILLILPHHIPRRVKVAIKPPLLIIVILAPVRTKRAPHAPRRLPHRLRKVAPAQQVAVPVRLDLLGRHPLVKRFPNLVRKVWLRARRDRPPRVGILAVVALCL